MVDTLSESATLTEEYFNMCKKTFIENRTIKCPNNLEYTGSIYAGKIQLGNRCFEIEVALDTVNSLPAKFFSYFDHVITGGKHYWILPPGK